MASNTHNIYLLLGSNIGDKQAYISKALQLIDWHIGTIVKASALYQTEPWGIEDQEIFLNQAVLVCTTKSPHELMRELQRIELYLGKYKIEKYGPRTIDIDILFYDDQIIQEPDLEIPHPRMCERNFVLTPLAEIAGEMTHPTKKMTIHELKELCIDKGGVSLFYQS